MKTKKIPIPLYTGKLVLHLYSELSEISKKYPDQKEVWEGICFKNGNYEYVMALHTSVTLSTLHHECVHIVNYIFGVHGVKLDVNNDEHQAYFSTWVFEELLKFLCVKNKIIQI